ncbi:MAG: hypothetical protein ACRDSF_18860 [Pseudonocardiaceae bacterium]
MSTRTTEVATTRDTTINPAHYTGAGLSEVVATLLIGQVTSPH